MPLTSKHEAWQVMLFIKMHFKTSAGKEVFTESCIVFKSSFPAGTLAYAMTVNIVHYCRLILQTMQGLWQWIIFFSWTLTLNCILNMQINKQHHLPLQLSGAGVKVQLSEARVKVQLSWARVKVQLSEAGVTVQLSGARVKVQLSGARMKVQLSRARVKVQLSGARVKVHVYNTAPFVCCVVLVVFFFPFCFFRLKTGRVKTWQASLLLLDLLTGPTSWLGRSTAFLCCHLTQSNNTLLVWYWPPTVTLAALRCFLSECMLCQNFASVRISSRSSALLWVGSVGATLQHTRRLLPQAPESGSTWCPWPEATFLSCEHLSMILG